MNKEEITRNEKKWKGNQSDFTRDCNKGALFYATDGYSEDAETRKPYMLCKKRETGEAIEAWALILQDGVYTKGNKETFPIDKFFISKFHPIWVSGGPLFFIVRLSC